MSKFRRYNPGSVSRVSLWDDDGCQVRQGGFSSFCDMHHGVLCQYRIHIPEKRTEHTHSSTCVCWCMGHHAHETWNTLQHFLKARENIMLEQKTYDKNNNNNKNPKQAHITTLRSVLGLYSRQDLMSRSQNPRYLSLFSYMREKVTRTLVNHFEQPKDNASLNIYFFRHSFG